MYCILYTTKYNLNFSLVCDMTLVLLCLSKFLGQTWNGRIALICTGRFSKDVKIEWKAPPVKTPYVTGKINSAPSWLFDCVYYLFSKNYPKMVPGEIV